MKKLLIILCTLAATYLQARAQAYQTPGGNGQNVQGLNVLRALTIPKDTLRPVLYVKNVDSAGSIAFGRDSLFYGFNGLKWIPLASGGGSGGTTLYTGNGSLAQNRVIDGQGNTIAWNSILREDHNLFNGPFVVSATNSANHQGYNTVSADAVYYSVTDNDYSTVVSLGSQFLTQQTTDLATNGLSQHLLTPYGANSSVSYASPDPVYVNGVSGLSVDTMQAMIGDLNSVGFDGVHYFGGLRAGVDRTGFYVSMLPNFASALTATGYPAHGLSDSAMLRVTHDSIAVNTPAFLRGATKINNVLTLPLITSKILKTDGSGNVVGAIAGTDYMVPGGSYINNSSTYQTAAVYNVDRGLITQATPASSSAALPAANAAPFTIAGGNGTSTTASTGTVIAGRAGDISIRPGQGGNQNTAGASFGGGGRGGNIDITAGNGGLGNGTGMLSGNGGTMTVQGGDAGPVGTGAIAGEAGFLKLAGGSANPGSNGNGKSIFIIPGAGYGSGFHGDTYIGTSPALVYRGRALVGFTSDPSLITTKQIFQVNGTSWFKDTLTIGNIISKLLKTDAAGNVIPAVAGTDYGAPYAVGNLTETGSGVLTIMGGTGAVIGGGTTLQVSRATTSANGYLTSTDWNTFNNKLSTVDTTNIATFSAKVRSLFSGTAVLTYNQAAGNFSMQQAGTASTGYLTFTDWNTFNNKLSTVDTTNISNFNVKVRSLFSGTAPITYANGLIGISQATTSTNGYLTSTDWNTFNGKLSSAVTSVALSLPSIFSVSGSPVTTTGTLTGSLATQTANTVFAGPTTGGVAVPTFRALVAADIPTLGAYIQNQTASAQATSNFWISGNGQMNGTLTVGSTTTLTSLTAGGLVKSNVGGVLALAVANTDYAPATGSTAYAPISASANYIQNQNAAAQTGNAWITGNLQTNGVASIFGSAANTQSTVQIKAIGGAFNLMVDAAGNNGTTNNEFFVFGGGKYFNIQDVTGNVGINTQPTSKLHVNGSVAAAISTVTGNTTLDTNMFTILCNNTANIVVTLPAAATCPGRIYNVKKISNNAFTVSITPQAAESLDGAAAGVAIVVSTFKVNTQLQSNGTGWYTL